MKLLITGASVLCLAALGYVYTNDPSEGYGLPPCSFKALTDYHCPGCGGTRSVHALLHGRFTQAFHFNPLFIAGLVVVGIAILTLHVRRYCGHKSLNINKLQGGVLAIAIFGTIFGFGIVRNMKWYPWLKAPIHEHATTDE
ncbi:MAG: hypothetical protein ACI9R3_004908 [Verrucomicrobiales bacterium]|jgi:hypothetical protein